MKRKGTMKCCVCHRDLSQRNMFPLELVRLSTFESIRADHPDLPEDGFICLEDLNHYRTKNQRSFLEGAMGDLKDLEQEVVEEMHYNRIVADNVEETFQEQQTVGNRLSDALAEFGGSWTFIIIFLMVLCAWMILNTAFLFDKGFDPYPYILLNLVLSCLAALQAPVIMMSQKRLEARDRLRSQNDYKVNLKAELEIRHLHAKIDHFIIGQWFHFLEFEKKQDKLLHDLINRMEDPIKTS